jgi:hypothetical protein
VCEADPSRARGLRCGELDVRWEIEFQRGRLGAGKDGLAIAQRQTLVAVALESGVGAGAAVMSTATPGRRGEVGG